MTLFLKMLILLILFGDRQRTLIYQNVLKPVVKIICIFSFVTWARKGSTQQVEISVFKRRRGSSRCCGLALIFIDSNRNRFLIIALNICMSFSRIMHKQSSRLIAFFICGYLKASVHVERQTTGQEQQYCHNNSDTSAKSDGVWFMVQISDDKDVIANAASFRESSHYNIFIFGFVGRHFLRRPRTKRSTERNEQHFFIPH